MRHYAVVGLLLLVLSLSGFAAELRLVYDENGNLITGDGKYRVYNSLNQLSAIYNGTNSSGVLLEAYTYHPTEERILVKKVYFANGSVNQTVYYLSPTFVRVSNASGNYDFTYVRHEGQLVAQSVNGVKFFIHGNHEGSSSVVTSDVSSSSASGSLPQLLVNYTFCSDSQNFTLGSGWSRVGCVLTYAGSDYGGILSSPFLNLTAYVNGLNITYTFASGDITNTKFSAYVSSGTSGNVRYNQERQNSTHQHFKHDSAGYSSTNNYPDGTTVTVLVAVNMTSNLTRACVLGGSCSNWESVGSFTPGNYITIYPGAMNGSYSLNVTNILVYNTGTPYNTPSTTPTILETTHYAPFGEQLNNSRVRFGYEGKESDSLVGDTDFNFRKYKPQWGLFTQPDTLTQNVYDSQDLNPYSFERNNPMRFIDQSGHYRCDVNNGCFVLNLPGVSPIYSGGITYDEGDAPLALNRINYVDGSQISTSNQWMVDFFIAAGTAMTSMGASRGGFVTSKPVANTVRKIDIESLPPEAQSTLRAIDEGRPLPYSRDGGVWRNEEGLLPKHSLGYYKEYTIPTPGATTRAEQRFVLGEGGETYYTADHYGSFSQVNTRGALTKSGGWGKRSVAEVKQAVAKAFASIKSSGKSKK